MTADDDDDEISIENLCISYDKLILQHCTAVMSYCFIHWLDTFGCVAGRSSRLQKPRQFVRKGSLQEQMEWENHEGLYWPTQEHLENGHQNGDGGDTGGTYVLTEWCLWLSVSLVSTQCKLWMTLNHLFTLPVTLCITITSVYVRCMWTAHVLH